MIYINTNKAPETSTENFSGDNEKDVVTLSYEVFFNKVCEDQKLITKYNTDVERTTAEQIRMSNDLKSKYHAMSAEDGESKAKVRGEFTDNVKKWFLKVWTFIVYIFQAILNIVINIVKTIILYIEKFRLQKTSLHALLQKDKSLSFSAPSKEMKQHIDKFKKEKYLTTTIDIASKRMTFDELHQCINNPVLVEFIKQPIFIANDRSEINLSALSTNLNKMVNDIKTGSSINEQDENLTIAEATIRQSLADYILSGEITSENIKTNRSPLLDKWKYVLMDNNVKGFANMLTFGSDKFTYSKMETSIFLKMHELVKHNDDSGILTTLRALLAIYEKDSELVIGKGGYLDIMGEIFKKYKSAASADTVIIKKMQSTITDTMSSFGKVEGGIKEQLALKKFKRFTKLVLDVKNAKHNFVYLRQCVLGNILSAYSIMDKSLMQILVPGNLKLDVLENAVGKKLSDDSGLLVGGKNGTKPSDFDDPYSSELDE